MRVLAFFVIIVLLASCAKDTPTPEVVHTTIDGTWTYTTPDKAVKVTFDLTSSSSTSVTVSNATIVVLDTEGNGAAVLTDVDLPEIGSLRINQNDASIGTNYSIEFTTCSVSTDFKKIMVSDVEYNYAPTSTKTLSNISITRKP